MTTKKNKNKYEDLIITPDMDDLEIESVLRQRIQWRQRKVREIYGNLTSWVAVNIIFWGGFFAFTSSSFPWPIFVTFISSMAMVNDFWELYQASSKVQARRDEHTQEELEREKARLGLYGKPKRAFAEKSKNRPLRISSDGEIVPLEDLLRDEDEQDATRYQHNQR